MPDAGYRWWLNWSLVLPVLALVAAVGTQGLGAWRETSRARGPHLANLIATSVPGWLSRELPLGPNEFVAGEVEKTLNYDEVFYREYTRGEENFAVYTAYWGAGKMQAGDRGGRAAAAAGGMAGVRDGRRWSSDLRALLASGRWPGVRLWQPLQRGPERAALAEGCGATTAPGQP